MVQIGGGKSTIRFFTHEACLFTATAWSGREKPAGWSAFEPRMSNVEPKIGFA
jgi:hypothetical protein